MHEGPHVHFCMRTGPELDDLLGPFDRRDDRPFAGVGNSGVGGLAVVRVVEVVVLEDG